jgi:uncharacterized phage protein (TIGR01671 family)
MRQIKFRVWDESQNNMWYINDLYWFEENFVHSFDENPDLTFQQFTGLKDKDGREIYEGDIVDTYVSRLGEYRLVVEYHAPAFDFFTLPKPMEFQMCFSEINDPKIIGNIFENPELLE